MHLFKSWFANDHREEEQAEQQCCCGDHDIKLLLHLCRATQCRHVTGMGVVFQVQKITTIVTCKACFASVQRGGRKSEFNTINLIRAVTKVIMLIDNVHPQC